MPTKPLKRLRSVASLYTPLKRGVNETSPKTFYAHCSHEPPNVQVLENQRRDSEVHGQSKLRWDASTPRESRHSENRILCHNHYRRFTSTWCSPPKSDGHFSMTQGFANLFTRTWAQFPTSSNARL